MGSDSVPDRAHVSRDRFAGNPGGGEASGWSESEITGNVPASIRGVICSVATSVHGGDAPVNQLTIIVTREMAFALRAKTPDADNLMLALLNRWMTDQRCTGRAG